MSGPERLDMSGARWSGPGVTKEQGAEANIAQSQTSTQRGQADLPYIAPTAQAQLDRLILQNEDLQRQLEKARKGEPLRGDAETRLITDVDAYDKLMRAIQKFDPDYVGTVFDLPGQIESGIQKRLYSGFGTPGQANFWSEMKFLDMLTRNKFFGASLTGNEKEAYAETTISPGDTAETALTNLKRRAETVRSGIQRNVRGLVEGGYRPAQINAQLGQYLPELNPRWMSASNERVLGEYASREDFDPAVYKRMLLEFGDANGVRLDAAQAEATANAVAQKRAEGVTSFGGDAVYQDITKQNEDEAAAAAATAGGTGGGGTGGDGGGLGWGETLGSALINLPRSTAEEVGGIWDAVTSPIQTAKSIGSLGGALLSKMGVADFDESSADALGQYYINKYGSIEGFKKELANNPASILADVATVLTAGAGTVTKLGLPAKIAKLGRRADVAQQWVGAVARNVDPITAMTNIVTKAVPAVVKVTGKGTGRVTSGVLGMSTGAGGESIRRAADVGYTSGRTGERSGRELNFLAQMRGGADLDAVVGQAEALLRDQQVAASQAYKTGMVDVSKDATQLSFDGIDATLSKLRDRAYFGDQIRNPTAAKVYEEVKAKVDEWRNLDPAQYHTPEGMDALKQNLGGITDSLAANGDRAALSIATGVYDEVRKNIAKQVPSYAKVMKSYEDAANNIRDIRRTFSLTPGANVDTKLRKLQSLMRNNVNTSYGYRQKLAESMGVPEGAPGQINVTATPKTREELLAEYIPATGDELMDALAAQNLNSWEPRGLQRLTSGAAATSGLAGIGLNMIPMAMDVPSYLSPANLAAIPLSMPRAVGEAAYYGGRAAGTAGRLADPVTSRFGKTIDWLADKQKEYRDPLVYSGFAAQNIGAMQEEPVVVEEDEEFITLSDGTRVRKPKPEGMAHGGTVQAFRNGGNKGETKDVGYDYANALRTLAQGASFGTADEAEGYVSSLFSGRPYKDERDERRRLIERYALANPNTALALEGVGMIGGSILAPSLGATRAVASAPRLARIGAAFGDDLAQGVAYTAGKANEMRDIPRDIRKDALGNAAAFGVATGVEQGGRAAGRRVAGKVAGTDRGYQAALMLKRLLSKY
jgi:hypothetical protein